MKNINLNIEEFSLEFIRRLRSRCDVEHLRPSVRQSIALTKLLRAMLNRKGVLQAEDYVKAALAITPPELKDIALIVLQEMFGYAQYKYTPFQSMALLPLFPPLFRSRVLPSFESLDEKARRILSKVISGNPTAIRDYENLAKEDPVKAARLFHRLRLLNIPSSVKREYAKVLSENISTLLQFSEVVRFVKVIPSDINKILRNAYERYSLSQAYKLADKIDRILNSNMRELVVKYYWNRSRREGRIIPLEEVALSPAPIKEWQLLLRKAVEYDIARALKSNNPIEQLKGLEKQLKQYIDMYDERWCIKPLRKCLNLVRKKIKELSKEKGKSRISSLKRLLKRKPKFKTDELAMMNYEEAYKALEHYEVNYDELLKKAIKYGNKEAVAAMAHRDLVRTLKAAKRLNALPQVLESLTAGPGENLLKEWYRSRRRMPPSLRELIRDYVKEVLIKLSLSYTISNLGGLEGGFLPSYTLRPYEPGEDPSLVDIEESLDNILSQGKIPRYVRYEDLLVMSEERGKAAVIMLNDISGSMAGEKELYMSLCSMMLLYAFRNQDLGIALFESNTYVLKRIEENVDIDDIADELLNVDALGGTCISAALLWAQEQFSMSRAKNKFLMIFSDCAFYDYETALRILSNLVKSGIKIFVIVPAWSYDEQVVKTMMNMGIQVIFVKDLKQLPYVTAEIINTI